MAGFQTSLRNGVPAAVILHELAHSIIPSGNISLWKRHPSISNDGMPIVLSYKATREKDDYIRLLIEPGSLQMNVAQQITYALTKLDALLGLLHWRSAASEINALIEQVLPHDDTQTSEWHGGIWLGAEVKADGSKEELRIYLNLRHGSATERWQRLVSLVSNYTSDSINPFLEMWQQSAESFAIPVGLGIVIADGKVKGIRAYVSIETPSIQSVEAVMTGFEEQVHSTLVPVFESFIDNFGEMHRHSVTIGFDFVPGMNKPYRVKTDISCQSIDAQQVPLLSSWIATYLAQWLFEPLPFQEFIDDIHNFWQGSIIQYLSLGFTPELQHATIYVQPTY